MKMNFIHKPIIASALVMAFLSSCTDLEIDETDSIITKDVETGEFTPLTNPASALNDLYNKAGADFSTQEDMFALSEVTSDELLVPTRGTDWGDNGVWRQLHTHTWRSDHQFILNSWNKLNGSVFRATEIIESNPEASVVAEAKFLRAFNMFFVMDLFGSVPFRGINEGPDVDPMVMTRSEAFDFVEKDLNEAMTGLLSVIPGTDTTNKATKEAAEFLLAKLYLNASVYKGTDTFENADMQKVIDNVDAIASKGFAIQEGYFQIFEPTDDTETILWLRSDIGPRIWNTLHYNDNAPDMTGGGWNGFATLAEFYDSFEGDPNSNFVGDGQEERRGFVPDANTANAQNVGIGYGFLINQQYDADGSMLKDRQGQPLQFTKDIPSLVGNGEAQGMRIIKYHPYDPTDTEDTNTPLFNSFRQNEIFFRYADAHLMKAEAMMRMGGNATAMVNELRARRADTPALPNVDEEELLAERGRELYDELWRRNDLVRFGQFTAPWALKEVTGDPNKNLFPIPETALLSNPNLVQNPGY
ncbi:MAG TPA: RagB/SusD family nutrient uptake outer membrane protein [Leeuwenhoekiella sp.]|nr:RagB/SusD family nutrient uptake outer membrane protein [Leeuwenhoekiella sp.]